MSVSRFALSALSCFMVLLMIALPIRIDAQTATPTPLPYEAVSMAAPVRMSNEQQTSLVYTIDEIQAWETEHWWGTANSLVIVGLMENPGDKEACVKQGDFSSRLDNFSRAADPNGVMDDVHPTLGLDYIGRWQGICVKPGASQRVYIAFDADSISNDLNWETFEVIFKGKGFMLVDRLAVSLTPTAMTVLIPAVATALPTATITVARVETRQSSAAVNLRTCPRRDEACVVVVQLAAGAALAVIGTEQGDEVSGSTLWYKVDYQGQIVYAHSSLVAAPGAVVAPVPTAVLVPSNNQSVAPVQSGGSVSCQLCSEITSCDEAYRQLAGGCSALDRDKDGIPCEALCGG